MNHIEESVLYPEYNRSYWDAFVDSLIGFIRFILCVNDPYLHND